MFAFQETSVFQKMHIDLYSFRFAHGHVWLGVPTYHGETRLVPRPGGFRLLADGLSCLLFVGAVHDHGLADDDDGVEHLASLKLGWLRHGHVYACVLDVTNLARQKQRRENLGASNRL